MSIYYWITFALTFVLALAVPTKLTPTDNVIGSLIVAMFGFVLWPVAVLAAYRTRVYRRDGTGWRDGGDRG